MTDLSDSDWIAAMPQITEISFSHNQRRYNLSFAWDDEALIEGEIAFPIEASVTSLEGEKIFAVSAEVGVKRNEEDEGLLYIRIGKETVFEEPLRKLFHEDSVVGRAMESVHAGVFGGHPFIGCLIRSGLSATVGQILDCKTETADIEWFLARAKAIGRCLQEHIPQMLLKTSFRAARCIYRAGF